MLIYGINTSSFVCHDYQETGLVFIDSVGGIGSRGKEPNLLNNKYGIKNTFLIFYRRIESRRGRLKDLLLCRN